MTWGSGVDESWDVAMRKVAQRLREWAPIIMTNNMEALSDEQQALHECVAAVETAADALSATEFAHNHKKPAAAMIDCVLAAALLKDQGNLENVVRKAVRLTCTPGLGDQKRKSK